MCFKFFYKIFIVLVAASKLFESNGFVHEFLPASKWNVDVFDETMCCLCCFEKDSCYDSLGNVVHCAFIPYCAFLLLQHIVTGMIRH